MRVSLTRFWASARSCARWYAFTPAERPTPAAVITVMPSSAARLQRTILFAITAPPLAGAVSCGRSSCSSRSSRSDAARVRRGAGGAERDGVFGAMAENVRVGDPPVVGRADSLSLVPGGYGRHQWHTAGNA